MNTLELLQLIVQLLFIFRQLKFSLLHQDMNAVQGTISQANPLLS